MRKRVLLWGFRLEASLNDCHRNCFIDKIVNRHYRDVLAENAGGQLLPIAFYYSWPGFNKKLLGYIKHGTKSHFLPVWVDITELATLYCSHKIILIYIPLRSLRCFVFKSPGSIHVTQDWEWVILHYFTSNLSRTLPHHLEPHWRDACRVERRVHCST